MIGAYIDRLFAGIMDAFTWRKVDNNRLARDVVYHAAVGAQMISAMQPWNAEMLHDYVRRRIRYVEDTDPMNQRLRMPWRTVFEGAGDCKSTAILIASVAKASGRHTVLRFVDQTGDGWDHVFAVVDGVAMDPLEPFGAEIPYIYRHDELL